MSDTQSEMADDESDQPKVKVKRTFNKRLLELKWINYIKMDVKDVNMLVKNKTLSKNDKKEIAIARRYVKNRFDSMKARNKRAALRKNSRSRLIEIYMKIQELKDEATKLEKELNN